MPVTSGQGNPTWTRDETILAMDLLLSRLPDVPGPEDSEVIALSNLLQAAPIHPVSARKRSFRNPDGVGLKIQQLHSVEASSRGKRGLRPTLTDRAVWAEFKGRGDDLAKVAAAIRQGLESLGVGSAATSEVDEDEELPEGRVLTALHKRRERQRGFRAKVLTRNRGRFGRPTCEACERPSRVAHLDAGVEASEFEVHHITALAEAEETKTRLRDLLLLCANCHRLIHAASRRRGHCLSKEEFVSILRAG